VKRISEQINPNWLSKRSLVSSLLLFSMTSCSWLSNRKTLFGEEPEVSKVPKTTATTKPMAKSTLSPTVSRAEYNQLLKKYEALAREKGMVQSNQAARSQSPGAQPAPKAFAGQDPSDIVNALNNAPSQAELVETVDVFGKKGISTGHHEMPTVAGMKLSDSEVENQILKLRKAQALISHNKLDAALTLLKELENSSIRQIRVRTKFYLGELLFIQGEFDLAMQIYEEIIQRDAFSGIVIKVLGRLIVCSEKLKQKKKQQKYYSILHDFFESA